MSFLKNLRYYIFLKGKIDDLNFIDGKIRIKEQEPLFRGSIDLGPDDIYYLSYSKSQPLVGGGFLGMRTRLGTFEYRSKNIDEKIYEKMLKFLGRDRLTLHQKRIVIKPVGVAALFLILGGVVSFNALERIQHIFLILGLINILAALTLYIEAGKHIQVFDRLK